jgi:hypothetical protein
MRQTKRNASSGTKSGEPGWYHAYFVAMCESDRKRALLEIERARLAIQKRLGELRRLPPGDPQEMQDLTSALTYLGILLMHVGKDSGALLWE